MFEVGDRVAWLEDSGTVINVNDDEVQVHFDSDREPKIFFSTNTDALRKLGKRVIKLEGWALVSGSSDEPFGIYLTKESAEEFLPNGKYLWDARLIKLTGSYEVDTNES